MGSETASTRNRFLPVARRLSTIAPRRCKGSEIERHEAAKLLPARVNSVALNSVISDDGITLTQARLEMFPGDKRLLHVRLPKSARFWFAFVNETGVWPWREGDEILIPLEQQCR